MVSKMTVTAREGINCNDDFRIYLVSFSKVVAVHILRAVPLLIII